MTTAEIPFELAKEIKFTKKAEKTENAGLFGVFDYDDSLSFEITAPRELGLFRPKIVFYRDDDSRELSFDFEEIVNENPILPDGGFDADDYTREKFVCGIKMSELCPDGERSALLWYSVISDSGYGRLRLSCSKSSYRPIAAAEYAPYDGFQLTVRDAADEPKCAAGGIIYHVFVDRFAKSKKSLPIREDAVLDEDWENGIPEYAEVRGGFVRNNRFFGGSLWGVIENLDYLAALGVSLIYLSPIFEAYSNHKYDTGDYMKVDEMFGGDEALSELIKAAKERKIGIILDGVFNHTGADSRYFNKFGRYDGVGAYQSSESEYYKWYEFSKYPDKYRCWWGIDILPAVTTSEPSYIDFICGEDGVLAKYTRMGLSGWRLDVADELGEPFLEALRRRVKAENPNAVIFGEVWEDASNKVAYGRRRKYFRGGQLDSVMNYPLRDGIIKFVKYGDKSALFEASALLYSHYPKSTSDILMNHLGTHDTDRILTVLAGEPENGRSSSELARAEMTDTERKNGIKLLKLCLMLVYTMPGIPCIYYGDEAGMEGYHDPFNRMPFVRERADSDLTRFYAEMGRIRRSEPLLAYGYFEVDEDTPDGVFSYRRFDGDDFLAVAVNVSDKSYTLDTGGETAVDLMSGKVSGKFVISPKNGIIIRKKR